MDFDSYQILAARTMNRHPDGRGRTEALCNWTLGLTGESGEFAEAIKKHLFHGHDLDPQSAAKELGDVLWYVSALATEMHLSLADIARGNVEKLRTRYAGGFSEAASLARVDVEGA